MQLTVTIQKKPKAWKFKYRITILKKVQSVVSVTVSNRNLTESESQQVAASFGLVLNHQAFHGTKCNGHQPGSIGIKRSLNLGLFPESTIYWESDLTSLSSVSAFFYILIVSLFHQHMPVQFSFPISALKICKFLPISKIQFHMI